MLQIKFGSKILAEVKSPPCDKCDEEAVTWIYDVNGDISPRCKDHIIENEGVVEQTHCCMFDDCENHDK